MNPAELVPAATIETQLGKSVGGGVERHLDMSGFVVECKQSSSSKISCIGQVACPSLRVNLALLIHLNRTPGTNSPSNIHIGD
jgi:hypothetical protein